MIDNPVEWNNFVYRPIYKKVGTGENSTHQYVRHELPTGCTPLANNTEGQRISNGWEIFYKVLKYNRPNHPRHSATPGRMFPKDRASSLDNNILKFLGFRK